MEMAEFWTAEAMLGDEEKSEQTDAGSQEGGERAGDVADDNGGNCGDDAGGDEGSHFCLKWKHHQNNQRHMFSLLLNQEAFCDVTLACEGQLIEAHKLVLASCSPYFEMVLMRHYEKHPIIILKDVKYEDMKVLLQFMYKGEVNIEQEQLPSLLETAEGLKIRGLSEFGDEQLAQQQEVERTCVTPVSVSAVSAVKSDASSPRGVYKRRRVNDSPYIEKQFSPSSSPAAPTTNRGSKFWRQPSVIRVLEEIRDGNIKMDEGAKMLNVSYANMYQHFRCRYGKIKDTPAWLAQNEASRRLAENNEAMGGEEDTLSSGGADSGGGLHSGQMLAMQQQQSIMMHQQQHLLQQQQLQHQHQQVQQQPPPPPSPQQQQQPSQQQYHRQHQPSSAMAGLRG
ncbi:protein bric-a-brac 2-like isoform X2 [Bacillus rossius redtenbacheri]|uniref:protein bric-a-brac 2-like isoform X2 n=1 Tax=Bacillus rossius redtenbacheri TaxID=93214 RepID=UPI002FDC8700